MSPSIDRRGAGGPRTVEGIDRCKFNATRHGLTGTQIVIRGEDPARYDALRLSLIDEYRPASEQEAMLVERIAQCWWKLQRAERYEQFLFDDALETDEDVFTSKRFACFQRYRNSVERSWNRARAELAALKAKAPEPDPAESVLNGDSGHPESQPASARHLAAVMSPSANSATPPAPASLAMPTVRANVASSIAETNSPL